jgi:hypothetical protein
VTRVNWFKDFFLSAKGIVNRKIAHPIGVFKLKDKIKKIMAHYR